MNMYDWSPLSRAKIRDTLTIHATKRQSSPIHVSGKAECTLKEKTMLRLLARGKRGSDALLFAYEGSSLFFRSQHLNIERDDIDSKSTVRRLLY